MFSGGGLEKGRGGGGGVVGAKTDLGPVFVAFPWVCERPRIGRERVREVEEITERRQCQAFEGASEIAG